VLSFAGRTIVVVALCLAVGLHWLTLQSVAWTAMMLRNVTQVSFCQAVKRTFDGAHPCSLCHIVNKGKASDQKRDAQISSAKIDLAFISRVIRLLPQRMPFQYATLEVRLSDTNHSPPSPPPRAELA
jgi:hypothetical protein